MMCNNCKLFKKNFINKTKKILFYGDCGITRAVKVSYFWAIGTGLAQEYHPIVGPEVGPHNCPKLVKSLKY